MHSPCSGLRPARSPAASSPNNQLEEAGARTHMLLQVTLQGQPWLVDAGFGGLAPTAPLLLESEKTQLTPHGQYRLKPHRDGLVLCAVTGATQQLLYTFDRQPQRRIDLQVGNWFVSTHPHSPFRTRLMAARAVPDGSRHTLLNTRYTLHRPDVPQSTHHHRRRFAAGCSALMFYCEPAANGRAVPAPPAVFRHPQRW